jgi:hypothetical protein
MFSTITTTTRKTTRKKITPPEFFTLEFSMGYEKERGRNEFK